MTENQLKYLTYMENARHNAATEEINRADSDTRRMSHEEDVRANKVQEGETHRTNVAKETETHRANLAKEGETRRSNEAREDISFFEAFEGARANRARENENERTNKANEGIKTWDNVIKAFDKITDVPVKASKTADNLSDVISLFS